MRTQTFAQCADNQLLKFFKYMNPIDSLKVDFIKCGFKLYRIGLKPTGFISFLLDKNSFEERILKFVLIQMHITLSYAVDKINVSGCVFIKKLIKDQFWKLPNRYM